MRLRPLLLKISLLHWLFLSEAWKLNCKDHNSLSVSVLVGLGDLGSAARGALRTLSAQSISTSFSNLTAGQPGSYFSSLPNCPSLPKMGFLGHWTVSTGKVQVKQEDGHSPTPSSDTEDVILSELSSIQTSDIWPQLQTEGITKEYRKDSRNFYNYTCVKTAASGRSQN